jgi:hypothetical protein
MSESMSLEEARAWLRERIDDGAKCPCCTQLAKVYRRKITSGMAQALIVMWRVHGDAYFHLPSISDRWRSRDESFLRFWGLIEEATEKRDDGGRAGWWRVTPLGVAFVRGRERVPKYARIYDGRRLSLEGELISIFDALGERFDYRELMSA